MLTDEYEQKIAEQEAEYSAQLKATSKELHSRMEDNQRLFQQQCQELIGTYD
jgi:phage host-nuclease inhibitor protein Gam